jgi:hypothetical protein
MFSVPRDRRQVNGMCEMALADAQASLLTALKTRTNKLLAEVVRVLPS